MPARTPADPNVVSTAAALSRALNIPLAHVKAAKILLCPAAPTTGRYYIKQFKTWYDANLAAVQEYIAENSKESKGKGVWKERKERALALIAEIELRERQFKTLDKDKVIALMKQIGGSQAIILRNQAQDLPPRLLGKNVTDMGVILSKSYDDVCRIFNDSLDKWTKK